MSDVIHMPRTYKGAKKLIRDLMYLLTFERSARAEAEKHLKEGSR